IEKEYAANSDPLSELEDVFASLKNPQPKPLEQPAVKTGAWPKAAPASAVPRPVEPAARQVAAPPRPPARQQAPAPAPAAAPTDLDPDDAPGAFVRHRPDAVRKRSYGPLLIAAVMLAVVAGGGYGIWLNRDAFGGLLGFGGDTEAVVTTTPLAAEPTAEAPAPEAPGAAPSDVTKF